MKGQIFAILPSIIQGQILTQRSKEPPVLAAGVSVLESLLDGLVSLLTLGDFLEGLGGDDTLETIELQSVTGRHQVVVVDNLNERLDASAALNELGAHATGDLPGVALDTGDKGVGEGVRLGAIVIRLDNDGLFASKGPISISCKYTETAQKKKKIDNSSIDNSKSFSFSFLSFFFFFFFSFPR